MSRWWVGWVADRADGQCDFSLVLFSCLKKMASRGVDRGCEIKLSQSGWRGVPSNKRVRVHNNSKSEDLILKWKSYRISWVCWISLITVHAHYIVQAQLHQRTWIRINPPWVRYQRISSSETFLLLKNLIRRLYIGNHWGIILIQGTLISTLFSWMISMIRIPCFYMNHNWQEKLVIRYISGWNKNTPALKSCIMNLRVHPISRNSSGRLGNLQVFKNYNCKIRTRKAWHDVLRHYYIEKSTTEPNHPHHKPYERKIHYLKKKFNHIMDRTNTPALSMATLYYFCYHTIE